MQYTYTDPEESIKALLDTITHEDVAVIVDSLIQSYFAWSKFRFPLDEDLLPEIYALALSRAKIHAIARFVDRPSRERVIKQDVILQDYYSNVTEEVRPEFDRILD